MRDTHFDKICTISDPTRRSSLSVSATVSCALCGAKAHDPENVCDPVQLPEPGQFGD